LSRVLFTLGSGPTNRLARQVGGRNQHRAQAFHEAVLMMTQATNHAVFRTCEKLGCSG
jgi:dTDP-4-amino-4,6-dideoxy-D-galactose acyltransferase